MNDKLENTTFVSSARSNRMLAGAGVAAIVCGSAAVAYFDPSKTRLLPACPLFTMTGYACPGCGMTRGFHALFHGDILKAIDFNALIPIWAIIFGWVVLSLILFIVRGRGLTMWPTKPAFLWTFLVALIGFGILRNLPMYPFNFLFP